MSAAPESAQDANTAERVLIIHADDFGESDGITEGIAAAIRAGRLTSTSILTNMPASASALQLAPRLADRASFGVHLNFCEGRPLTGSSSLTGPEGRLHPKRILFARAMSGRLRQVDVEREISAQIGAARDAGLRVSHVDGHKHLHQLPVVSEALARVLPRFGIARVRLMRLRGLRAAGSPSTVVRELLAARAERCFARAGLRSPRRTVDLCALWEDPRGHEALVEPRGAVELCCHPGTEAADRDKPGSHHRARELAYLLSAPFAELLARSGARPVSYWQI